jgi:predicted dehydrogenase
MIGTPRTFHWTDARERLWYWGWREHKHQAGAGWSLDGGVHFADLFRFYLGEVDELFAIVAAYDRRRFKNREAMTDVVEVDVEDTTLALLKFANGVTGQWSSCSAAPGRETADRIIYGSEGSLEFGGALQTRTGTISNDELIEMYRREVSAEEWNRNFPGDIMDPIATELHDFIRWITTGEKAETDGGEGYKSEAIAIALFESHALNAPVKIADVEALKHELYQREINEGLGLAA